MIWQLLMDENSSGKASGYSEEAPATKRNTKTKNGHIDKCRKQFTCISLFRGPQHSFVPRRILLALISLCGGKGEQRDPQQPLLPPWTTIPCHLCCCLQELQTAMQGNKWHGKSRKHDSSKGTQKFPGIDPQRNGDLWNAWQIIQNNYFKEAQQTTRKCR